MFVNDDLQQRWLNLEARLAERFGKKPDMEAILFLVGIQEFGDIREKFTKEQKQDLMHVAVCSLLVPSGYYELESADEDGWGRSSNKNNSNTQLLAPCRPALPMQTPPNIRRTRKQKEPHKERSETLRYKCLASYLPSFTERYASYASIDDTHTII